MSFMFDVYRRYVSEEARLPSAGSEYKLHTFKFIKAVFDTVFGMINADYYDKPLIFIRDICLSLSRLFLTLY